jgi:tight adherence protein B
VSVLGVPFVLVALLAFFVGLATLVAGVLGVATRAGRPAERIRRRLGPYTVSTEPDDEGGRSGADTGVLGDSLVARSAVGLAERLVVGRGLDTVLDQRLEAAGLPMRAAEWLLLHVAAAVGGGLLMLLLTAGRAAAMVIGLIAGLAGPWAFLVIRRDRREQAFLAQLPDTLQLLSGSLKAGYSLAQALDTVVRQGQPPISAELNRALIESRLGVPTEDALAAIGDRLHSEDFSWVVMAIRIQREVGGNLAELLTTVSDTLRERERLRRQVQVLSAEGRMSGVILGALPLVFTVYLLLARPDYLRPMASPLGVLMVAAAVVLLIVGAIWVAKVIRVEV